jgi:hypothetical protein
MFFCLSAPFLDFGLAGQGQNPSNQGDGANSESIREQAGHPPHDKAEGKIKNYETSGARSQSPSLILFSLGALIL